MFSFGDDEEKDADRLAVVDGVGPGVGNIGSDLILSGGEIGAVHEGVPDGDGNRQDDDDDREDGDHFDEGEGLRIADRGATELAEVRLPIADWGVDAFAAMGLANSL